ncbi:MAG TPA: glycosyltransferase [Candidatus Latescibacteria bacterium]|nr:glycosyltransferase [Candidatus Handelsmanbacteria bacterium]HIL11538.1 glycosyltransferase [Candidatus Latescibacterota bacterium]
MTTPRVSVLMPVYNAAETLVQTLESIAGQSFEDFEVVAVDDGSEDGSGKILRGWAEKDSRFRVLLEEHRGIVEAPNRGLEECRGEFVARMDADDKMHQQRLEKQVGMLAADEGLSVVSCLVETFPREDVGQGMIIYEEWLNGLVEGEDILREFFIESPIANPSAMMRRRELVELDGYQDRGWPEDYDLWLRYRAAGKCFAKVPEILHYWREHEQRATHTNSRYSVENFLRAKAHYLCVGPLAQRDGVVVWGAGKTGRRIAKHLERGGCAPEVFVDITPKKIGGTLRGKPVISPDDLPVWWRRYTRPILLVAVASRGARVLIREHLSGLHMVEGEDYLCVA